jgi:hypothetical protein
LQRIYSTLLLLTLFSFPIFAQEQIGVAAAVNRNTTDLTLEQETKLVEAGYQIIQNHTIETDEIGKAQMLLLDGTAFSVGPNSSVVLDRFIYNPETAEGSLEVTARGLLRIVGGKVTKKQPALIRTNSATVGIRGGIGIVQTEGSQVNATFLYGEEMTVTPNCVDLDSFGDQCSSDFITTITEPGFSVTVESADSEPSEPEPVTEESLEAVQDELEASEEEPAEEESSSDESSSEESSDESSSEESSDESSSEESSDESSADDSSSEESNTDESSSEESSADDSVASDSSSDDASSDSSSDEPTTEVAQETESDSEVTTEVVDSGEGDSTEIEVDEGLLDSSGVSDVSSDVAPDELGTADAFEIETDIDLDVDDTPAEEVSEEVAETTQETTSEVAAVDVTEETEAEVAIFAVSAASVQTTLTENTTQIEVAAFALDNPADLNYNVTVAGEGSENFVYDAGSNSLRVIGELDYERQDEYELTVTFNSETGVSEAIPVSFAITNVNEQIELAVAPVNTVSNNAINAQLVASQANISETAANGTVIATFQADDPEQGTLTYTLSGDGSELLTVTNAGEIVLNGTLDYELSSSHSIVLQVSDGVNTISETIQINVINDNEGADISSTLSATTFAEDLAVGSAIAAVNAVDPEGSSVTYTLAGTGSDNFSIDAEGNITLANALDFESAASYELTVVADDGSFATTETITVTVTDVNEEPTVSTTLAALSFAEDVAAGTTIATSSASDPESTNLTYTLSGNGSENFSVDSSGRVSVATNLDYETATSHTLTLTASDGTNSSQSIITFNVNDVTEFDLVLSDTNPAINEGVNTGTEVTTSTLIQQDSAAVTYALTGTGSGGFAISNTGVITTNMELDYETGASYTLTVTATDGTNIDTETITITVNDLSLNTLATTLANSGAALAESTSSGTAVASSSINNPDNETVTYTLSGTGSENFSVDSSGNITTNATLDFETAKSYALTLTATAGSNSVTDTFTVNVGNEEELNSAVLRYSAAYNSASRSGFSATATRGASGSTLPAYYLEQIGTTASSVISDVDNIGNNSVPVEIAGGSALNWRYFFPIDTEGNGQFAFAPNSASVDAKYKSLLGTNVTTTISNSEVITAGRFSGGNFWFMATDMAGSNISYQSSSAQRTYGVIVGDTSTQYGNSYTGVGNHWQNAITGAGYTFQDCVGVNVETCLNNAGIDLDDVGIIVNNNPGTVTFGYSYSELGDWIDGGGNYAGAMWEHSGWSMRSMNGDQHEDLFAGLGWSGFSGITVSGYDSPSTTFSQSTFNSINNAGGTLDYSALANNYHTFYAAGVMNIPGVCNSIVSTTISGASGSSLFICDPGRTGSDGAVLGIADYNAYGNATSSGSIGNQFIMDWFAGLNTGGSAVTSTYNLFEDQVTLAGRVYTDAMLTNHYDSSPYAGQRGVFAFAVIPIENFAASGTTNDYFYPNFIPTNLWSYGDLGLHYCAGIISNDQCTSYEENYEWSSYALDHNQNIWTNRLNAGANYVPEGQSLWWQVLYPHGGGNGVSVGLWAQISFKDSYDGASGSTTRDDQESLLNVVISTIDYRKHDTTRYSAGDTGSGMDGYHYWSYQGATNADNDGLGINYGTSAIECATSNDSGCFWADGGTDIPRAAMITSSDPYKSGDMTLSVNYNSNTDTFSTGSFNAAIIQQDIRTYTGNPAAVGISSFRSTDFYQTNSLTSCGGCHSGFFSGILEFDVSGSGNSQLSSMRSTSTLATFNFDYDYDYMQVVAPMTISAAPANNYTSNWTTVDTGSMTLKFGDETNDEAKSAFISAEVFAAEIQDDGTQIDGSSGGSNNLAGVMVSYNTLDNEDSDLFHSGGNDSMPDTAYSTWGFWAMSSVDISPNTGNQNASVHLGTWVSGQTLAQNEIPTSGTASMSGAAVMNVAYRHNQTGTNYDVHKYTTTADVAASFTWGTSGYSGTLNFSDFDNNNPIVSNAGFTSFTVAITGTDHTYTGNSTTSPQNDWLGGASVAGALYGGASPDETGGQINVNLYKSGDIGTAGANDFYMAEGIYLLD